MAVAMGGTPNPSPAVPQDDRKYEQVAVGDLHIAQHLQRGVSQDRIDDISREFDWKMFETPTVSRRKNGSLVVIEGQNRVLALQKLDPSIQVTVAVLEGLTSDQESHLSLCIYQKRKPHSQYEQFWQLVRSPAGQGEFEKALEQSLSQIGLHVGVARGFNTVNCVGTIRRIAKSTKRPVRGAELVQATLGIIQEAFPDDPGKNGTRFEAVLVEAIAKLLVKNRYVKRARLIQKLSGRSLHGWLVQTGRPGIPREEAIRMVLVDDYNKGLRNGRISWST